MKGGAEKVLGWGAAGAIMTAGVGGAALLNDLKQKEHRAMFYLRNSINGCLKSSELPDNNIISVMKDLLRYLKTPIIKRVRFKWEDQQVRDLLAKTEPLPFFYDNIQKYQAIENKEKIIEEMT